MEYAYDMATESASGTRKPGELSSIIFSTLEVLADPYPLYARLRNDTGTLGFLLHAWVVTRYPMWYTCSTIFRQSHSSRNNSARWPVGAQPYRAGHGRQMLFLDPPDHTRLRALASAAFTPRIVERLRSHIQEIMDGYWMRWLERTMDVIADFASPLRHCDCGITWCAVADHRKLKDWLLSDFAEMLGNFQHNLTLPKVFAVWKYVSYPQLHDQRLHHERPDSAMMAAEVDGAS